MWQLSKYQIKSHMPNPKSSDINSQILSVKHIITSPKYPSLKSHSNLASVNEQQLNHQQQQEADSSLFNAQSITKLIQQ